MSVSPHSTRLLQKHMAACMAPEYFDSKQQNMYAHMRHKILLMLANNNDANMSWLRTLQ